MIFLPFLQIQQAQHYFLRHRILFILFLFSLPFSVRKVLINVSSSGTFNEYKDISIYLSDILLLSTILLFIINNKRYILSIEYWRRMFHVEHLFLPLMMPIFFLVWSATSIFWSESIPLAFSAWLHILEGYGLYVYILLSNVPHGTLDKSILMFHVEHKKCTINYVPRGTFLSLIVQILNKCSTWNIYRIIMTSIIFSALIQSFIGVLQFLYQRSLGITFFHESILAPDKPGIAKIILNGDVFIRGYAFFPHPNIFGGFMALALLMTFAYRLLFSQMFHVEHKWLYRGILFVQLAGLCISFSKSALIGYFLGMLYFLFCLQKMFHVEHLWKNTTLPPKIPKNVPRGTSFSFTVQIFNKCSTWNIYGKILLFHQRFQKMFHVEHYFFIGSVIFISALWLLSDPIYLLIQPLTERIFYIKSLSKISQEVFFQGVGIGQYVLTMQLFFSEQLLEWQYQPIHNVLLLIFAETGIIGLLAFLFFFFMVIWYGFFVPRGTIPKEIRKCSTWNKADYQTRCRKDRKRKY
ncbi:MAG: hypothetical protein ACSLEX_00620 [Minisyncoccota bacterium]